MTAQPLKSTTPSILIVLMGSLGDVARGLGIVAHLKAACPDCRITWLVEPKCADLVGLHPGIDHVIVFRRAWSFKALWDLFRQLRQCHFDITLDLQRHFKSGFFSMLSHSKQRIGFHRKNSKEFNWLFNNAHIEYGNSELSKLDHYFRFTQHLGLDAPARINFGTSYWDARKHLPGALMDLNDPLISIVLGSRWESKNWHTPGYIHLIQQILANENLGLPKEARVAMIGDATQAAAAREISDHIKNKALIDLAGRTSLLELAAVLKSSTAVVGPDSGPGHLAAAMGTAYISLFGPTSPERTAPHGCEHLVVQTQLDCIPCYQKQCPLQTRQCMYDIQVEEIMDKLGRVMNVAG
ncbi:MAG: glycosyltransferase family 9 protein [Deltaproteobacteria bacterium]|jgi:ADP-heptose:LPS heptosyltransferase|nr:glycosyltransferase family 9 protein [Deltaproteobacteria bacterium]